MSATQRLCEAVRRSLAPPLPVLAVSGGPDSVALLRAVRQTWPDEPLVVAHYNHQLRGEASDGDETFTSELSQRFNAMFAVGRADVRGEAERTQGNLEAVARSMRYAWLAEVARSQGREAVATAHTASDQAETVLHRLLRGAGFQGLRGIADEREIAPGVRLVRPLLTITRPEVLGYLAALGQASRHDASNDDANRTRNRIRHELLPLLEANYNPAIARVLVRLADQAEEFFHEEEATASELLTLAERPRAGAMIVLDRAALAGASRSQVRSLFRGIYRREGWPLDDVPFALWDRLAGVVRGEESALDLPAGVRIRTRGGVAQLYRV